MYASELRDNEHFIYTFVYLTMTSESTINDVKTEAGQLEIEPRSVQEDEKTQIEEIKEKYKKPATGALLLIFLIINTVMLCVGIATARDCPINPNIPIYIAVAGGLGIISKILPLVNYKFQLKVLQWISNLLFLVEFAWMIVGSVWIYGIYQPNYEPAHGPYCDKTAYLLAFWLLTINYIYIGLIIISICCVGCCIMLCVSVIIQCCKSIE
ncbi:hypothetical protein RN001_008046 [Aquatica leii]|uniref:Uncharacterized protein n=1 Tax=Aquatica leii TaxID=1421715 RepID=A0AAN7SR75_9COLE|nr:hypothetical protein RN001_008046 [Aquatica leii]